MTRPPLIQAKDAADVEVARRLMARLDPSELRNRAGARFVDASALPWLSGSRAGRGFLVTPPQRVLVRGRPAESCPISFAAMGPPDRRLADAAAAALTKCLADAPEGCGCQVVAAGSVLLVPRAEVAFATGISARIRAPGLNGFLVAEELRNGHILFRGLDGPVAELTREGDRNAGKVSLRILKTGAVYTGTSRPVGYRRGRLAERIYARDAKGAKLSLLIGFDPDELAQFAGGWLAFPPDA